MGNTFKELSDGDIMDIMLDSFHNKAVLIPTIDRSHEKDFAVERHKNGGSILIKNPNEYEVGTGATIAVQDITETTQTMTVATQKHVPVRITTYERMMSEMDFQAQVADPAMSRLVAEVENIMLQGVYKRVYNLTNTPSTQGPSTLSSITDAHARLIQKLAPEDNLHIILDPIAMGEIQGTVQAYFHKGSEISKAFQKGYIGEAQGFEWHQTAMMPYHTNGTRSSNGSTSLSTGFSTGYAYLSVTGANTNGLTIAEGDILTMSTVYDVHQETKTVFPHLKQFVCTSTVTGVTAGVWVPVSPTPYSTGAKKNCHSADWTAVVSTYFSTNGGTGVNSQIVRQGLAYHKDFCTFATAPLAMPINTGTAMQKVFEDVTLRMWQFSDGINDKHTTRFDILFGYLVQRPDWAVRFCKK